MNNTQPILITELCYFIDTSIPISCSNYEFSYNYNYIIISLSNSFLTSRITRSTHMQHDNSIVLSCKNQDNTSFIFNFLITCNAFYNIVFFANLDNPLFIPIDFIKTIYINMPETLSYPRYIRKLHTRNIILYSKINTLIMTQPLHWRDDIMDIHFILYYNYFKINCYFEHFNYAPSSTYCINTVESINDFFESNKYVISYFHDKLHTYKPHGFSHKRIRQ